MSYELRQVIDDLGDYEPETIAAFLKDHGDGLRLFHDPHEDHWMLFEYEYEVSEDFADQRALAAPTSLERETLGLPEDGREPAGDFFEDLGDLAGTGGVAKTQRLHNREESNGGDGE